MNTTPSTRHIYLFLITLLLLIFANTGWAQDSTGVRCLGRFCHSYFQAGVAKNFYIYLADSAAGLRIVYCGNYEMWDHGLCNMPGIAMGCAVSDTVAYVAEGEYGLRIVDVSDSYNPVEVGFCDTPGSALNVAVSGSIAYVADDSCGIRVIDVSNPLNPQEIGNYSSNLNAVDVIVSGNYAYVASGSTGLRVIDISDPLHPTAVGAYSNGSEYASDIARYDTYALLVDGNRVLIIDVSLASNPLLVNTIEMPRPVSDIAVYDSLCFVTAQDSGLSIIDIRNVFAPVRMSSTFPNGMAVGITIDRGYAFLLDREHGIRVMSFSDPTNPYVFQATYNLPGFVNEVAVLNRMHASKYMADGYSGIRISNFVYNPYRWINIFNASSFDTPGYASGIVEFTPYLYVADGPSGLRIINVWNDYQLSDVGFYDTPGWARRVAVSGSYAYVADSDSGLRIINILTRSDPFEVAFCPSLGQTTGIAIRDSIAYFTDGRAGLRLFDISNPAFPESVGNWNTPGFAWDVALSGSFAYVADGDSGLRVIDLSNLSHPMEVASLHTPGNACDVAVIGDYAYVTDGSLRLVNISDPFSPHEIGYYYSNTPTSSVVVMFDSCAYVGEGQMMSVYRHYQALGVIDRESEIIPQQFSIQPNYPNPFNSTTTIKYSIAKTSKVDLKVFDITGREVAKLIDFHQNPGEYTFKFDGTTLAAGTYFVRLQAGDLSQTQKIVLLK